MKKIQAIITTMNRNILIQHMDIENSNSIDNSSDSSLNCKNSPIIENNPEASVLTNQNLATLLFYLALYILIINIKHKWILVGIT